MPRPLGLTTNDGELGARPVLAEPQHASLPVAPAMGVPAVLELGWLHRVKGLISLGPFLGAPAATGAGMSLGSALNGDVCTVDASVVLPARGILLGTTQI